MDLRAEFALHLLAALGAGAAIGLERSIHGRPAGFRTHALVCMGGCLLMGQRFEYRMTIRTSDARNYARLAQALSGLAQVREFHISPAGA